MQEANRLSTGEFLAELTRLVAEFLGETHLSVSMGTSDAMRRFCVSLMEFTLKQRDAHPGIDFRPDLWITAFNGRQLTQEIVAAGDRALEYLERSLLKFKFVNVMIDAATVINMRVVHVTLANPFSGQAPIPFRTTRKEGAEWRISDYADEVMTALTELMSRKTVIPVAILHDRLAAQSTGIRKVLAVLRSSDDQNARLIVDVPCLNHLVNNAFSAAMNDPGINGMMSAIETLTKTIRTREALMFIKRKCPTPPKTRWIYIADTLEFIIRDRIVIEKYLENLHFQEHAEEDLTSDEYDAGMEEYASVLRCVFGLYLVINPLKQASLALECEQSRLADLVPIIRVLELSWIDVLKHDLLKDPVIEHFMHILLAHVFSRLRNETLAAWAVTREGRLHFRKSVQGSLLYGQDILDYPDEQFAENDAAASMQRRIQDNMMIIADAMNQDRDKVIPDDNDPPDVIQDTDDALIETLIGLQDESNDCETLIPPPAADNPNFTREIEEEMELNSHFKAALERERQKTIAQILEFDIAYDAYSRILPVILRYFQTLYPDTSKEVAQKGLDDWLFAADLPKNEFSHSSDCEMWLHLSKYDCMRRFSDVALRLLAISTSESDVERLISVHRYIVHDRMTNLSPDVLLARLRIRARRITESILA